MKVYKPGKARKPMPRKKIGRGWADPENYGDCVCNKRHERESSEKESEHGQSIFHFYPVNPVNPVEKLRLDFKDLRGEPKKDAGPTRLSCQGKLGSFYCIKALGQPPPSTMHVPLLKRGMTGCAGPARNANKMSRFGDPGKTVSGWAQVKPGAGGIGCGSGGCRPS